MRDLKFDDHVIDQSHKAANVGLICLPIEVPVLGFMEYARLPVGFGDLTLSLVLSSIMEFPVWLTK